MDGLVPLPNDPRPAIDVFIGYATGKVTDVAHVAHAAGHIALYGLGLVHDCPPLVLGTSEPDTIDGCCTEILRLTKDRNPNLAHGEVGAIDWTLLIPLVLQILQLFLKKK